MLPPNGGGVLVKIRDSLPNIQTNNLKGNVLTWPASMQIPAAFFSCSKNLLHSRTVYHSDVLQYDCVSGMILMNSRWSLRDWDWSKNFWSVGRLWEYIFFDFAWNPQPSGSQPCYHSLLPDISAVLHQVLCCCFFTSVVLLSFYIYN